MSYWNWKFLFTPICNLHSLFWCFFPNFSWKNQPRAPLCCTLLKVFHCGVLKWRNFPGPFFAKLCFFIQNMSYDVLKAEIPLIFTATTFANLSIIFRQTANLPKLKLKKKLKNIFKWLWWIYFHCFFLFLVSYNFNYILMAWTYFTSILLSSDVYCLEFYLHHIKIFLITRSGQIRV